MRVGLRRVTRVADGMCHVTALRRAMAVSVQAVSERFFGCTALSADGPS